MHSARDMLNGFENIYQARWDDNFLVGVANTEAHSITIDLWVCYEIISSI